MKQALSAVDLRHVVSEIHEQANGSKIDQVYVFDNKHLVIRLYIKDAGKKYLRIELPGLLYMSDDAPAAPERPPSFTLFLRKMIAGGILKSCEQIGLERTCVLTINKKGQSVQLFIELFDKGNVIIIENGIIRSTLELQQWASRSTKQGEQYIPVRREHSLLEGSLEQFVSSIDTTLTISKALATNAGLGGEYASELCARCTLDPQASVQTLQLSSWRNLQNELRTMIAQKNPTLYFVTGKMVSQDWIDRVQRSNMDDYVALLKDVNTFSPFKLKLEQPNMSFPTFNSIISLLFGRAKKDQNIRENATAAKQKISKTQRILAAMEQQQDVLAKTSQENSELAEFIYEHYQEVNHLLTACRAIEKNTVDKATIAEEITKKFPQVTYDKKTRTISLTVNIR